MKRSAAAALGLACVLAPVRAAADDWLAVLPACSIDEASRPELALVYPAPGLPALVPAGEPLVVRVRVPAALTPPPGVQQERVLQRYTAELSAPAERLGVGADERHRHTLPVSSVRPDGASTLIYRMRIDVPAYVAAGTYSLVVRTPFGSRQAERAVRVLEPGIAPRVQRLPEGEALPPSASSMRPVDAWLSDAASLPVAEADAPSPTPAPVLLARGRSIALRSGRELWVRTGCGDERAFERELAGVLASEARTRVLLAAAPVQPPPTAAELVREPVLSIGRDAASIDNTGAGAAAELSLLLPFAASVRADSGRLSFHPAHPPAARAPRIKLARWRVPAGARARLQLGAPAARHALKLQPERAHSGEPAHVRVIGADPRAQVAFALGFARSRYGSPTFTTHFPGPLAHPVRAQVFAADGSARAVEGHVWVEPHRPPNCAVARAFGGAGDAPLPFSVALAWTVARLRQRRRAKNAPGGREPE